MSVPAIPPQLADALNGGAAFPSIESLFTLGLYASISLFLIGTLLFLAWFLGQKTRSELKTQPYESGVIPTGEARLSHPVPFYLVAIFFIVFDVEMIFIVSWAISYDLLGWAGFIQITFFIFILFLGLVHLCKSGALDWGPPSRRRGRK